MSTFGTSGGGILAGVAFTLLLAGACVSDLRLRRIPNRIVAGLLAGGIVYTVATTGLQDGLRHAVGGGVVGLLLWLPFWFGRVLGAGDVKLVAAAGTWLGVGGVIEASLFGAVAGGVLGLWALARHGGWGAGMTRLGAWMLASRVTRGMVPEFTPMERRVPYGVAIGLGAAAAAWVPGLIW